MLTEKDRKSLQFPGRHPFLAFYAIWFVPLYFALSVVLNLDAAAALAAKHKQGQTTVSETVPYSHANPTPRPE